MNKPSPIAPWVGSWLRGIRTKSKETVETVAAKLDMHATTLRRREGGAPIPADALPIVLEAYGATLAQFVAEAKRRVPS